MCIEFNIVNENIKLLLDSKFIKCQREVKLLATTTDDKLIFTSHINNLCGTDSNR